MNGHRINKNKILPRFFNLFSRYYLGFTMKYLHKFSRELISNGKQIHGTVYFRNMMLKQKFSPLYFGLALLFIPILFSVSKKRSKSSDTQTTTVSKDEWVAGMLKKMTIQEKIGQFFMVSAHPNDGKKDSLEVLDMIRKDKVGGVIFFQTDKKTIKRQISSLQSISEVPLFIGLDAEWGTTMRLFDGDRFPYAYTLGAADDPELSKKIASMMALECRQLGIHINFSPVADVNSNPRNPVIGFRSFGENPKKVAEHVRSFVNGLQENGVLACIKHFPGHGNTDTDSHYDLPVLNQSRKTLETIDLYPFIEGISSGARSAMLAHVAVPSIDPSNTPASLSSVVIKQLLQKDLGFKGLVISDALNMKAVADRYGKSEVVVKAILAGCDIVLCPESVREAIALVLERTEKGEIPKELIDSRCRRILEAKYDYIIKQQKTTTLSENEIDLAKYQVYEKAITVLKNEQSTLPFSRLDKKIARISIGVHTAHFRDAISRYAQIDHFHFFSTEEALERWPENLANYDEIIISLHSNTVRTKNNFGFGSNISEITSKLPAKPKKTLVIFGNPLVLQDKQFNMENFQAIVAAYENHGFVQDRVGQLIFGAIPSTGHLPITLSEQFPRNTGIQTKTNGRLKFTLPEELGIDSKELNRVDDIALNGIEKGAYPGCQIVVALEGKVIYRKSFGKHTYDGLDSVRNTDVYDIASISKIAGSTVGLMRLQTTGKFTLENRLGDYLPKLLNGHDEHKSITLKEMMAHQAGLPAWIAFYKKTLKNGELNPSLYSSERKKGYELNVAKNIWLKTDYEDSIYYQILNASLGPKKYEYSDLGYYFVKKIIEQQSDQRFETFLLESIYQPLGLQSMRYHPLDYFAPQRIVPTEKDLVFRKQLIRGYVHDPGAAMLGGIGGHAGLFSNATDLAALMQMILNKGTYGGVNLLKAEVVDEYTRPQFTGNRRGAGFDRPNPSGGGTCHALASQKSFGHSGFTGTLAWADPENELNYVFLSNRVCPSQDNWKLRDMNIRTEIQRVVYEAVKSRKK